MCDTATIQLQDKTDLAASSVDGGFLGAITRVEKGLTRSVVSEGSDHIVHLFVRQKRRRACRLGKQIDAGQIF